MRTLRIFGAVLIATIVFALATPAFAAVTFDATAQGKANAADVTFTISITIGAGANQAAAVGLMFGNNAVTGVGITGAGATWSLVAGTDTGATFSIRTMMFRAVGLATGAQTLTVSWTTASQAGGIAMSCFGVNQTTSLINGKQQGSAGATTDTVVITSATGDLTMDIWGTMPRSHLLSIRRRPNWL